MGIKTIGQVALVVVFVGIIYLLMLVIMPIFTDFASTANTTMANTSNVSNYPGAQEGVLAAPWFLWFAPAVIGMAVIVFILRDAMWHR